MELITKLKSSFEDRFWAKVNKPSNGCWEWTGLPSNSGYGRINICGIIFKSSRVSWILHNGDIPKGMMVLHKCNNKMCVNPDHLYLGNSSDNANDREIYLRENSLPHNGPKPKLKISEIWLLKRLYKGGIHYKIICKIFRISKSLFYNLKDYPDYLLGGN